MGGYQLADLQALSKLLHFFADGAAIHFGCCKYGVYLCRVPLL